MDPLSSGGIFIGRWFGINVRIHFTLIIFAIFRLQGYGREYLVFGIALIVGMYFAFYCMNSVMPWRLGGVMAMLMKSSSGHWVGWHFVDRPFIPRRI
jgi:hypothetical protein